MINKIILVLALAAYVASQQGDDDQTPQLSQNVDSVTMQLVGSSGQIKLFPASDSNRFIRIKMSKVQEVDSQGSPIGGGRRNTIDFSSMAQGKKCGTGAGWSALQKNTTSSGAVYYTSTFTCDAIPQGPNGGTNTVTFKMRVSCEPLYRRWPACLLVGANVDLLFFQVDLFSQSDNVIYGNKTVAVYKNTVKFSTAVTGWQFDSAANKIQYTIFMGSQGRNKDGTRPVQGVDTNDANSQCTPRHDKPCAGGKRIKFDNSFLDFPTVALAGPDCSIDTPLGSSTCTEYPVTPTLSTTGNIQVRSV
jgi:hypothetical protein